MKCQAVSCTEGPERAIDLLVGNEMLVRINLCDPHYREAWAADRIGWFGGDGRQVHHRDGNPRNNDPDNLELR